MARFRRLTAAEARTLARAELLDRVEAEQRYWHRKGALDGPDRTAFQEFSRIMHAAFNPGEGLADALAYLNGERGSGRYWDQKPGIPDPTPPTET